MADKKIVWGLIFSIIGLFLLGFHLFQYIDLIQRISMLLLFFGQTEIKTNEILLEAFGGFILIIIGIILLSTANKEVIRKNGIDNR